jgi:hypothetical protein
MTLSAGIFAAMFVPKANAGCGDMSNLQGPLELVQLKPDIQESAVAERPNARGMQSASVVGMWNIQFISKGNVSHNPTIPDGAIIDFGYNQLHSDGTEILNSGTHAPATENFCLGVWGQTGFLAYEVNHFALSYNATTGALANKVNIREQITLSPSGNMYTGTFTLDVYDLKANHVDHLAGTIVATRVTVDTTP